MMKYIKIYLLLCGAIVAASCNKYLDVKPKGEQVLNTTTDYNEWLNNPALYGQGGIYSLNLMADFTDNPAINVSATDYFTLQYLWKPSAGTTLENSPVISWNSFYQYINYYNTVINNVNYAIGSQAQNSELKAEALVGRAYEYLYLVNMYGKEYDPATAAGDLSVPFVISEDVNKPIPPRSTVKDMYGYIIADLNAAIPNLPADNSKNRFRCSVYCAYSILARTYFYMRDYINASRYAQMALQDPSLAMLDYNTPGVTDPGNYPQFPSMQVRNDVIYARFASTDPGSTPVIPTLGFVNSYDPSDLRLNLIKTIGQTYLDLPGATRGGIEYLVGAGLGYQLSSGTTVSEMKLIIAEAAARSKDLSAALDQVNDIRKYRFPASSYQPLASGNADTVLSWVLRERGFELPFTGLRWMDMRRLDAEGEMPAVYRYDGGGNLISTLAPHSNRYVLQIPFDVLVYNPGMPQNP